MSKYEHMSKYCPYRQKLKFKIIFLNLKNNFLKY